VKVQVKRMERAGVMLTTPVGFAASPMVRAVAVATVVVPIKEFCCTVTAPPEAEVVNQKVAPPVRVTVWVVPGVQPALFVELPPTARATLVMAFVLIVGVNVSLQSNGVSGDMLVMPAG
jgi:hypothetical protein